ncbi:transporter substrate-binding domain-containing diguanylate cyclase [Shewanella sp. 125m-7]
MSIFIKGGQNTVKTTMLSRMRVGHFAPLKIILALLFVACLSLTPIYLKANDATPSPPSKSAVSLIVANSKAWKPFSYLDDKGEPRGLLVDLWKEFGEVNQIEIKFLLTDWQESIDNVRDGKADVHAGLLWSNDRAQYLDYGNNLAKLDGQLFVVPSLLSDDLDSILDNVTLGVIKGSYEDKFIQGAYPQAKLIRFNNNEQMINAAISFKLNAFVADFQVANFYLYTSNKQSAFTPVQHLYTASVKPAVVKGNEVLLDFIKSGFKLVEQDTLNRIHRKWLHVETVYPSYLMPLMVIFCLSIFAIYIIQLKRTVSRRTQELNVANEELKLLAGKDPLTGINNRRFFISEFEQQNNARKSAMALLLFDIDWFKSVNDNFGHHVGDQVIKEVVNRVSNIISEKAVFGRIGGEEFCVFMTELDETQTIKFANKVQCCISDSKMSTDVGEIAITVSLGAIYSKKANIDCTSLMTQADLLMYKAKKRGRNCFEFMAR